MAKRVSRSEQVAVNREELLAAGRAVFLRKGFHQASVDEIAAEAGFSKGVVYSQFGSKDDLFFALLEQRIEQRAQQNLEALGDGPAAEALARLARLGAQQRGARAWTLLVLEYRLHAARDPELNRRYEDLHARTIAGLTEVVARLVARAGASPQFAPGEIARLIFAVDNGLALEEIVAPDARLNDMATDAFAHLLSIQRTSDGGSAEPTVQEDRTP